MIIEDNLSLVETLLEEYRNALGRDFLAYRNHVYRVVNFCFQLSPNLEGTQRERIIVAGCFHDLGIWTEDTFDYLEPSVALVKNYLRSQVHENWFPEISQMINWHHRFRTVKSLEYPLVEVFRQADWIDVSLGLIRFGLSKKVIHTVKEQFPNAGFHKRLVQLTLREMRRRPWKPLPMMRW